MERYAVEGPSAINAAESYENTDTKREAINEDRGSIPYRVIKRSFDIIASALALILLSPVILIIALAIKAEDGGPLFYSSERVATGLRHIKLHKFKSMYVGADKHLDSLRDRNDLGEGPRFKMEDDPRVTKVGKFLRKTSLDEIPQLWNVLKGDISIIGPRPHSVYEVEQYSDYALQRFRVKSGVLCFSECMGRSDLSFDESIELDMKYLKERSLLTDIRVMFLAAKAILLGKGAH